jgi:hypothetical protein
MSVTHQHELEVTQLNIVGSDKKPGFSEVSVEIKAVAKGEIFAISARLRLPGDRSKTVAQLEHDIVAALREALDPARLRP